MKHLIITLLLLGAVAHADNIWTDILDLVSASPDN